MNKYVVGYSSYGDLLRLKIVESTSEVEALLSGVFDLTAEEMKQTPEGTWQGDDFLGPMQSLSVSEIIGALADCDVTANVLELSD